MKQVVYLLFLSKRCSVERSLYRLTDRPELNDDAGQNDEQDHLDYGYASWDGLVSLNRLSVGCGTTPRRQSGDLPAFECYPCGLTNAATSRILANPAVIPIL